MRCLCCGKPFAGKIPENLWHPACIKRFFGTAALPEINLSEEQLLQLATQSVDKGYTVTGVQKKLSLHLTTAEKPRLTLVGYPAGYILKPQDTEYPHMPEAEQLVMCMADVVGIKTVPHALIKQSDSIAYITKRVDRLLSPDHGSQKLAMEDFCQLDYKPTEEKYHGSYERCAKIISRYSARPGFDLSELFMRLVFCFLTGNSDMHLKNFSLIETAVGSNQYVLSPAYDLLPVQLLLPSDLDDTALTLNGKKQKIRRKDFLIFAETAGIPQKAATAIMDRMLAIVTKLQTMCEESLLPEGMHRELIPLIEERARRINM